MPSYRQTDAAAGTGAAAPVLQMANPDPLPPEEEERLAQSMRALAHAHAGPAIALPQGPSAAGAGAYMSMMMVPAAAPHGVMVDAGMIRVPQRAYAVEHAFEQPPPAYDAIDFSLQAQVRLAPPHQPPSMRTRF